MPIIKSAVKRMKQTAVRRERNAATKKGIKGAVKAFLAKPTAEGLAAAQSEYDTAVKKGLLKKAMLLKLFALLPSSVLRTPSPASGRRKGNVQAVLQH